MAACSSAENLWRSSSRGLDRFEDVCFIRYHRLFRTLDEALFSIKSGKGWAMTPASRRLSGSAEQPRLLKSNCPFATVALVIFISRGNPWKVPELSGDGLRETRTITVGGAVSDLLRIRRTDAHRQGKRIPRVGSDLDPEVFPST